MFTSKDEIKKALYKTKPQARFVKADKYGLHYGARIHEEHQSTTVTFTIPPEDIATGTFYDQPDAQLLARWIDDPNL